MAKLTNPQIDFLRDAAAINGSTCVDRYKPMIKLRDLGFIEVRDAGFGSVRAIATDAGRAALKEASNG